MSHLRFGDAPIRSTYLIDEADYMLELGFLEDVGASYILLRSFEGDSQIYADIYAIKFITISSSIGNRFSYVTKNLSLSR